GIQQLWWENGIWAWIGNYLNKAMTSVSTSFPKMIIRYRSPVLAEKRIFSQATGGTSKASISITQSPLRSDQISLDLITRLSQQPPSTNHHTCISKMGRPWVTRTVLVAINGVWIAGRTHSGLKRNVVP